MNITILNTFDNEGGAAIAARRLCQGFRELDQNSVMLVRNKEVNQPYIYKIIPTDPSFPREQTVFRKIQQNYINWNRSELSNTWFSIPYPGYPLTRAQLVAEADVINIHWIAEFQSVETIAELLKLGKTVVWTLHDENPYTGGCHYTAGCKKYRGDCRDCSQLRNHQYQIPNLVLDNKKKLWRGNLTIVTPSRWLGQCAGESSVFSGCRVEVIPNALETDIYKPVDKNEAKRELGIDPQTVTLLFGAHSGNEKRKGFAKLLEAMKNCLKDKRFEEMARKGAVKILTFGPSQEDLEELGISIESLGYQKEPQYLATLYSAADLFVLPSLEDNLPNTMLESMACGTPVVSFNVGGMPDVIENGATGFMAPPFNIARLGECILELVYNPQLRTDMSRNCRRLIEEKYRLKHQAGRYLELFKELQNKKKSPKQFTVKPYIAARGDEIHLDKCLSRVESKFRELYDIIADKIDKNKKLTFARIIRAIKLRGKKYFTG